MDISRRDTPRGRAADLSRPQIGLDLRAIRIAEGVRAALAWAVVVLASEWLQRPFLVYMGLAAFFTCLCDIGCPIRRRLPRLLAFTFFGALIWSGFGLLRGFGLPVVVPLACGAVFCASFARVWSPGAAAVGNILSIVIILSLDEPLGVQQALVIGGMFIAGGLWATFLAIVVWRLHPYQPSRVALSDAWRRLADLAADMLNLVRRDHIDPEEWEAHARAYRRAVRDAIEQARAITFETFGMRGQLSSRGSQALLRLQTAEQLFGALIALSALLETSDAPTRKAAERLLRLLRPALVVAARAMQADKNLAAAKLENAMDKAVTGTVIDPTLNRLAEIIADQLRIVAKLETAGSFSRRGFGDASATPPLHTRMLTITRNNLTWNSAVLRHAVRAAVITAPALALSLLWDGPFAHWLPITVVVTLQPFYGATWQRALERIGGTVLGGLIGAGCAFFAHTPIVLAGLMIPISIVAFSARQVSFGAFIACVTPLVVVLMELAHPEDASWKIAALRALFTILGGAIAVAGWLLLWPSWEPDRLRTEVRGALRALGGYAKAVMTELLGDGAVGAAEASRRLAGVATNNLEASLTRSLQEPGHNDPDQLEAAMVVDAILRRIAGQLSILRHDPSLITRLSPENWRIWRDWIHEALNELARGETPPARPRAGSMEQLSRIARQIELMEGALGRFHGRQLTAGLSEPQNQ